MGGLVLLPLTVVPLMGGTLPQAAQLIGTTYVCTGLNTLLQTTVVGNRLPLFQVPSFSYLPPTLSILAHPTLQAIANPAQRFEQTMQVVSGSILVAGMMQTFLAYTGLLVPLLKFISPVTITCIISSIALGYSHIAFAKVSSCFPMGLTMIFLGLMLSQGVARCGHYRNKNNHNHHKTTATATTTTNKILRKIQSVVSVLPLFTAMAGTWLLSAIFTAANVWEPGNLCRTDASQQNSLIQNMPFWQFPNPIHGFRFEAYGIIPMFGALLASMSESVGDHYACARISGAPPPTFGIICRGLAAEGIGVMVDGLLGKIVGSTSSSGDIAIMAMTGVASRAVVQMAALILIVVGTLGKVSAALALIPPGIVGGVFCIVLGSLVAVGLANLQFLSLSTLSSDGNGGKQSNDRNLFVIGFALFNGLSIAGPGGYFSTLDKNPFANDDDDDGHVNTWGQIAFALLSSPMVVALMIALFLDNTLPGTEKERGLDTWSEAALHADIHNDPAYVKTYALPFGAQLVGNFGYLEYFQRGAMPDPPANGQWPAGRGDIWECWTCTCWPSWTDRSTSQERQIQQQQQVNPVE
ncbi:hypothetical protein ACA910_013208 [Epithemia clementina (nom. ined.)]